MFVCVFLCGWKLTRDSRQSSRVTHEEVFKWTSLKENF